jgi:hypothetical protein
MAGFYIWNPYPGWNICDYLWIQTCIYDYLWIFMVIGKTHLDPGWLGDWARTKVDITSTELARTSTLLEPATGHVQL